jgi:hypothetical protein
MAVREPGTELANSCHVGGSSELSDRQDLLRKTIGLFEDRLATWKIAHPVQADLVNGLIKLEKLAT